jgi:hypothetical protein
VILANRQASRSAASTISKRRTIVVNRQFGLSILLATIALTMIIMTLSAGKAFAGETRDERVHKVLIERTEGFCSAVLPNWFASDTGLDNQIVRSVVTDCYMGHARLAVFGIKSKFPLSDTDISEVPAALLHEKTGINLDIYRPLAGRVLQTGKTEE